MKTQSREKTSFCAASILACWTAFLWAISTAQAATHYQLLKSFGGSEVGDLADPNSSLIQGSDGALYGTTLYGTNGYGGVFKLNRDGSGYTILHDFSDYTNDGCGTYPAGPLMEGSDGLLYGTTRWISPYGGPCPGGQTIFRLAKDGSRFGIIHTFDEGRGPASGLIQGDDGNLYGTTQSGGANGAGTVFKVQLDGTSYTVLYDFGKTSIDASIPPAGLLKGKDGVLYGVTEQGGSSTNQTPAGLGTVFKLNQDGSSYTILHSFGGEGDGWFPRVPLVEGTNGVLYGTTEYSGEYMATGPVGAGSLFKLNKDGSSYKVIHTFSGSGDGANPRGLIEGRDRTLYGTTESTGTNGSGTIFNLKEDGSAYTVLFTLVDDNGYGVYPESGLVQGSDGALYGTTVNGGGTGTAFQFLPPATPGMLGVATINGTVEVTFSGEGGARYQVLRSIDIITWSVLDTVTMPAGGILNYPDSSPSTSAAFYRAAWVP